MCRAGALTPEASRTTFQYSSVRHIGCQSLPSPGRVKTHRKKKSPIKAVQPETVCTLILSSLFCLVSLISFYFIFVSREVDVVVDVVAVSGNWRWKHYFGRCFYVCLNYPAQCVYVLMLLLPYCIQRGHIDPKITLPNPIIPLLNPYPLEIHCITPPLPLVLYSFYPLPKSQMSM